MFRSVVNLTSTRRVIVRPKGYDQCANREIVEIAMSAASAAADPPPAAMPTAVVPTAGEAAALSPVPALPTPQELDHVGSFYAKCLAAYDARNHKGTSGRATACDTHRVYAIAYLAARCAVREARERRRERNEDGSHRVASERRS